MIASPAAAAEAEPVRFEVDGPRACVDAGELRDEIASLGGRFRDANLDDRARTFRVEVTEGSAGVTARLVVRDLVFREHVRQVAARSCTEARRSLALFVVTALDEAPPPAAKRYVPVRVLPPLPPEATTSLRKEELVEADRPGSGGIAFGGFGAYGDTVSAGFRANAVLRTFDGTRIGLAGAIAHESREAFKSVTGVENVEKSTGLSQRGGILVSWGAPWNDSIVGLSLELGVLHGEHRGVITDRRSTVRPREWSFVAAYAAPQLVFQVPFKNVAVRPIASFGTLLVTNAAGNTAYAAVSAETGIVWQAW
jgi:hypothetical protein